MLKKLIETNKRNVEQINPDVSTDITKLSKLMDPELKIKDSLDQNNYYTLLELLDITRLKKIIKIIDSLEIDHGDKENFISSLPLLNKSKINPLYHDEGKEGKELSYFITKFSLISEQISNMSQHKQSITDTFRNIPWDDLKELGNILKFNLIKASEHAEEFRKDLGELKIRFEQIINIRLIQPFKGISLDVELIEENQEEQEFKDLLSEISDPETERAIKKLKKLSLDLSDSKLRKFEILQNAYKDIKLVDADDSFPRGLPNIRKITEPLLDAARLKKIVELIETVNHLDIMDIQGREALLMLVQNIGEISKGLSAQSYKLGENIPFKELNKLRTEIAHCVDNSNKVNRLFKILETEVVLFQNIQKFIIKEFKPKILELQIKISDPNFHSSPLFLTNPLPKVNITQEKSKDIEDISNVFKNNVLKEFTEENGLKLNIISDIFLGKLPLPINNNQLTSLISNVVKPGSELGVVLAEAYKDNKQDLNKTLQLVKKINNNKDFKFSSKGQTVSKTNSLEILKDFLQLIDIKPDKYYFETRGLTYEEKQLNILLYSLEKIATDAEKIIVEFGNSYINIRDHLSHNRSFHQSHLFYLTVIGQCIQNLREKELYKKYVPAILEIEFEGLRWIRNALMHDSKVEESGSLLSYYRNDFANLKLNVDGARVYDSYQYLASIKILIDELKKNINANPEIIQIDGIELIDKTLYFKGLFVNRLKQAVESKDDLGIKIILNKIIDDNDSIKDFNLEYIARQLLNEQKHKTLEDIYNNFNEIKNLEIKFNIKIIQIFGEQLYKGYGSLGLLIESKNVSLNDQQLANFKIGLQEIIGQRIAVVTNEHLIEFLNQGNGVTDTKEFLKTNHACSCESVINGIKLYYEIKAKNEAEVKKILASDDVQLNLMFEGYSLVQHSNHFYTKHFGITKLLIKAGADVNKIDKRGQTLAHYAAEDNNLELLNLLEKYGADFNIRDASGKTPFELTTYLYHESSEACKFLENLTNIAIEEKLISAIKLQDIDKIKNYISHLTTELLNKETKEGLPYHVACAVGNLKIIRILEEAGCNSKQLNEYNRTALHEACYADNITIYNPQDRLSILKYLIEEKGIEVNEQDNSQHTALDDAIWSNNLSIIRYLLEKGANPNLSWDYTPLLAIINMPSVENRYEEVIKLLLKFGADPLMDEGHVGNALHLAAERGHVNVINLLINFAQSKGILSELLQPSPEKCWVCKGLNAYEIAVRYNKYKVAECLEKFFPETARKLLSEIEFNQPCEAGNYSGSDIDASDEYNSDTEPDMMELVGINIDPK